jgi:hypothetical protein
MAKENNDQQDDIELPQEIVESFARFLIPEIRKYYESEQGKREFAEWQARQEEKEQK